MMRGRRLLIPNPPSSTPSSLQRVLSSNIYRRCTIVCSDRLLTTYSPNKSGASSRYIYQKHYNQHSLLQHFSSSSGSGGGGKDNDEEDPFGLTYNDNTPNNIGTSIPPSYTRDETTGKFTGEVQSEITPQDLKLLNLNAVDAEQELVDKFVKSWDGDGDDEEDREEKLMELAERVREEQIAFGSIGRAPRQHTSDQGGGEKEEEDGKYTSKLTPSEASTLKEFLKRRYNRDLTTDNDDYNLHDDIPIQSIESGSSNVDSNLSYLSPSAQKILHESNTDTPPEDPFLDLMPSDLNPTRKVNRRRAKLIPKQLLHHNNLSILRRYVTPGGQIMNRVQSRLGAKDQRKVARMVKRARHLGLIPHMGQWKYEDHGNVSELQVLEKRQQQQMKVMQEDGEGDEGEDLSIEKDWEKELKRRGLVIEYKNPMSPEMLEKMLELEQRILVDGGGEGDGGDDTVEKEED